MPGNNPHDELFKATFSITSEVAVFLKYYLPHLGRHLHLKSLKQEQTSYISENLKEFFSDIVYTCKWKSADDSMSSGIKIAFLLEHKSYLPDNIYIQLLRYLTETYHYQYQNKQALQLTIPVVVYHGADKWQMRTFEDYFELPDQY
ncbi:MAG TPA: Rpn family recombination-promoting nuclease/putative transposase [Saprospiraceae bacterium]|nr:Rpn family recombination-promoting nuclease/putative transposase [Saprospiraceae bacterium]HMQ83010.1 Rpn family recombination-promoting nuclease/putative transposase [Saprospiraceae bacterium]